MQLGHVSPIHGHHHPSHHKDVMHNEVMCATHALSEVHTATKIYKHTVQQISEINSRYIKINKEFNCMK